MCYLAPQADCNWDKSFNQKTHNLLGWLHILPKCDFCLQIKTIFSQLLAQVNSAETMKPTSLDSFAMEVRKWECKKNPMMWCGNLMLWVSVCSQKLDSEGVKAISGKQNICHTLEHAAVCRLRDGVDVWRHFMPFLPSVHLNDVLRIDGQVLVGVNYHTEETRVCLEYKQKNQTSEITNRISTI